MTDTNGLEAILGAMAGAPPPVKATLFAAASRLIGGAIAFPAALLRRPAQEFEDTTNARGLVSQGLAAALVEEAKNDPAIMKAVAEAYLPVTVRKSANRIAVAQKCAVELEALSPDPSLAKLPSEDWSNVHGRYSEDASSDELQLLFAKILAGEIASPGSYSVATMRVVSELSQSLAQDFEWAWAKSMGHTIWRSPEFRSGDAWVRISRLRDTGLISPVDSGTHETPFAPLEPIGGLSPYVVASPDTLALSVFRSKPLNHIVPTFTLTRIGVEIGALLKRPDYRANLKALAESLQIPGVERISIFETDKPEEVLFNRTGSSIFAPQVRPSSEAAGS
jgi:hypothetical protein